MSDIAKDSVKLLPCPLCASENVSEGVCWIGERKLAREPAVRCVDCGCRATRAAWDIRATPPAAPAQSNGDEEIPNRLRDDFLRGEITVWNILPEAAAEIESLRSQLSTAEATYLQFCKKHDEKMAKAIMALEGYAISEIYGARARAVLKEIT